MMTIINGVERTLVQGDVLVEKAGMRMKKIWECRSQVSFNKVDEVATGANGRHD